MIYLSGLDSIVEAIYLDESLDNRSGNCNIFVNPDNIGYLIGKTIIINTLDYPSEKIETLIRNNCKIISRVSCSISGVEFCPYILRINSGIIWNGVELLEFPKRGLSELLDANLCSFSLSDYTLYFPKIFTETNVKDVDDNLTFLGWVLQQVGINIIKNTPFINLDLIKTKKIMF